MLCREPVPIFLRLVKEEPIPTNPHPARRLSCSWRRWLASSSRGISWRMKLAGCCARRATTSSWSSPSTRRGRGGSMNSPGRSAGARRRSCPGITAAADICVVPTIAQDGLSITSVEAMASSVPVVASRIGGLPYAVSDGLTGMLFEPGDPVDLARQIARLLDDPDLRRRMGLAGRKRFEDEFTWETVSERDWRPLLSPRSALAREGPQ